MSISFIETKDPKDFPEHKELFSLIENFMGYLPHAFLLMADNPNLLNAFSGLSNEIFSSDEIDNQTKQLIALASSLSSGCKYCQSHTSYGAERAGVSVEKILTILDYQNSKHFSKLYDKIKNRSDEKWTEKKWRTEYIPLLKSHLLEVGEINNYLKAGRYREVEVYRKF